MPEITRDKLHYTKVQIIYFFDDTLSQGHLAGALIVHFVLFYGSTKALTEREHFLQGNRPLCHLLNAKSPYRSYMEVCLQ